MQPIPIPENITQVTKDLAKKVFTMLCLNVDKNDNNSNNGEQGNKDNKNKDELDSLLIDKVNTLSTVKEYMSIMGMNGDCLYGIKNTLISGLKFHQNINLDKNFIKKCLN